MAEVSESADKPALSQQAGPTKGAGLRRGVRLTWWRRKWRVACFTGNGQRVEDTGRTFRLRLNADRERDVYAAMDGLLPLDWRVERGD